MEILILNKHLKDMSRAMLSRLLALQSPPRQIQIEETQATNIQKRQNLMTDMQIQILNIIKKILLRRT